MRIRSRQSRKISGDPVFIRLNPRPVLLFICWVRAGIYLKIETERERGLGMNKDKTTADIM
jgi:hypothetical protein